MKTFSLAWRSTAFAVLISVALTSVLWFAATLSPKAEDQRLAAYEAPAVATITAEVKLQKLTEHRVARGSIVPLSSSDVIGIKPPPNFTSAVVTKVHTARGTTVRAGAPIIEVCGRPTFILPGSFGSYRDLKLGDKGPDVLQLERALAQVAKLRKPTNVFTMKTARALRRLYTQHGYQAPTLFREKLQRAVPNSKENSQEPPEEEAIVGGQLPAREVRYIAELPAIVLHQYVDLGSDASGKIVTLGSKRQGVQVSLSAHQGEFVGKLQPGALLQTDGAEKRQVRFVGNTKRHTSEPIGQPESDAKSIAMFEFIGDPGVQYEVGQEVQLTLEEKITAQDELTVPSSALWRNADGATVVKKNTVPPQDILVQEVARGRGTVAIRSVKDNLEHGDQVILGYGN